MPISAHRLKPIGSIWLVGRCYHENSAMALKGTSRNPCENWIRGDYGEFTSTSGGYQAQRSADARPTWEFTSSVVVT